MQAREYKLMSGVVSGILLLGAAGGVRAADADNDGVDDALDRCCNTPIGVTVDSDGRPVGDLDLDCDTDIVDYQSLLGGLYRHHESTRGSLVQPSRPDWLRSLREMYVCS